MHQWFTEDLPRAFVILFFAIAASVLGAYLTYVGILPNIEPPLLYVIEGVGLSVILVMLYFSVPQRAKREARQIQREHEQQQQAEHNAAHAAELTRARNAAATLQATEAIFPDATNLAYDTANPTKLSEAAEALAKKL